MCSNRSDKPKLHLAWCNHAAAKYAVEHWHYSRTMPCGKLVKVGVWEDEKFIGCVLFGRGANTHLCEHWGLPTTEICELMRIALTDHRSPVTRIVAIAIRMLKQTSPGLKLIASFADPMHGHLGSIYQAGNWIYVGRSQTSPQYLWKGEWRHHRRIRFKGSPYPKDLPKRMPAKKYVYMMPLDEETRMRVEALRQPYPKELDSASVAQR